MERRGSFEPYLPRLLLDWHTGGTEVRDGSLLSVDVSGFTAIAERLQAKGRAGAEELVLLLGGVFEAMIGIAERAGGDVLKFRGDALLIFFDGPAHARRAATAAADMQWFIDNAGPTMSSAGEVTLRMSAAVYSGPCHFFLVDSSHRELVVTGPAATEAVRLESAARAGEVLVSPATAAALDPERLGAERDGARLLLPGETDDPAPPVAAAARDRDDLEAFIPLQLRSQLHLTADDAEHRTVTASFIAFSGVQALLDEGGPDAVHAELGALGAHLRSLTDELAVTWLESDVDIDGGKLYLVAGAPTTTGTDEERVLRLLRQVIDRPSRLSLRAGVNRGPVFAGDVGSSTRRTYAVLGDVVNLAARLAARAEPGQILATPAVLERSRTLFATESQQFIVKGKERALTAYRVGEIVGIAEDAPAQTVALVGRDAELGILRSAVESARMRQAQIVEIVGEPGIGKSRLVTELRSLALGFTQLTGNCDPYRASVPYLALRGLLRPLAGITDDASPAEAGERLTPWVAGVMPDLAPFLPLLAIPFDAEVAATPEVDELDPAFRRARLHSVVEQFLLRVLVMPTLLLFEDTHWMDDASLSLLEHLSHSEVPHPWLTVVTRRPAGTPLIVELGPGRVVLELEPLGAEHASELALAAAGSFALAPDIVAAVSERSGGNPLFVRELVAAAREGGGADGLPDSVESLITARIDTLESIDRFVLRNNSALGTRCELWLVREVLAQEVDDLDDLERWRRLGEFLVWEGSDALRFLHDLFRTVAYEGLPFRRRREMHGRIGLALEARAGDDAEIAPILSLHFARAGDHTRAWKYSVQAGDLARQTFANLDAAELYGRALESADHVHPEDEAVARVAEALGDVLELAGHYDDALTAYGRARSLWIEPADIARQSLKEGVVRERLADYPAALERYESALDLLGETAAGRAQLELAVAGVKYRQGHFREGIEWATHAADHAAEHDDRHALAHAHYLLHVNKTALGESGDEHAAIALPILEEIGDLVGRSSLLNNLGIEAYYQGRWGDATDLYRRAGALSARAGDVVNVARALNNEAEIRSDQGRLDEAQELLVEAQRVWRAARYTLGTALTTSNLGRLAARAGRFDEADILLAEAEQLLNALGAEALEQEARVRRLECFVLSGRFQDALALLERADAAADGIVAVALERLHGYALLQARRPEEARPLFDASAAAARSADARYELALTLKALASLGDADASEEAQSILDALGVQATPPVPLP